MRTLFTAGNLVLPDSVLAEPWLLIEDNTIHSFGARGDGLPQHDQHQDLPGALLAPSLFDIHVHGAAGHDVMEGTPEGVAQVSTLLAQHGVGAWLPTLVTAETDRTLRALDGLATLIEQQTLPGAAPLGLHMEGPFLSYKKRGVHPPEFLQAPSIELFDRFWQAARGNVRLITIAPELPGALELIQHASSLGVRVSLGHSDATAVETRAGMVAGGVSATHTYNAMRGLEHREPGMLGVVLDDENLFAEIIADGRHVDPAAVRIFWHCKGAARAILITDGLSATGMPEGHYTLGSFEVEVKGGVGWHNGIVAGSVLTMDRAVRNFADFTRAPLATVARLGSANPAALTGFAQTHGVIAPGRRADVIAFSPEGQLVATCIAGHFARVQ